MSTQSYVAPFAEDPYDEFSRRNSVEAMLDPFEFENSPAVFVDHKDEFDNFTIDLSKLPPGTKFIKFWRG
jgi:hypothetical protein